MMYVCIRRVNYIKQQVAAATNFGVYGRVADLYNNVKVKLEFNRFSVESAADVIYV